jgi:arylsulfatase A-like enzyme
MARGRGAEGSAGPGPVASAAGAACAGAAAGALAQALELAVGSLELATAEVAFVAAAAAAIGAACGAALALGLGPLAARLARGADPAERAARLQAVAFGATLAALTGVGALWKTGLHQPIDVLPEWTKGALAALAIAVALAGSTAWLASAGWRVRGGATVRALALASFLAALAGGAAGRGAALALAAAALTAGTLGPRVARRFPRAAGGAVAAALAGSLALGWPRTPDPSPEREGPPEPGPRSVVLILLDTQRADALGPYGAPAGATPVLDALAAQGEVFEEILSPSPWTIPSHASLFTGLPPRTHRCWFGDRRWLEDSHETLAERFRAAGFETGAIVANGYLLLTNVLQGFEWTRPAFGDADELVVARAARYSGVGPWRWIDKGAAESIDALESWLEDRDRARPFFLFVNWFEVHEPYHPPATDRALPPGATPWDGVNATRRYEGTRWHSLRRDRGREEDVIRALYAGEVRYQDRLLGRLLAALERHVRREDLVVAVTSDHGENLGDGGRWGHLFALNDALLHVPLVLRGPGVSAGARVPGTFSTFDIGPTLLALAGVSDALGEGRSLLAPSRRPREATFAEAYPDYLRLARLRVGMRQDLGEFSEPLRSVRSKGYRLVVPERGPARLYELAADPREEHDLAAAQPERVAELRARLAAWEAAHPRQAARGGGDTAPPLDDETRRRLEALGYL